MRSGAMTKQKNKGKELDGAWVHKAPEKVPSFDVRSEKEVFMEARKDFTDPGTSTSIAQQHRQNLVSQSRHLLAMSA